MPANYFNTANLWIQTIPIKVPEKTVIENAPLAPYLEKYDAGPLDIPKLKFHIDKGPWIAGGAVRKIVMNEPLADGDWDIFCRNGYQMKVIREKLKGDWYRNYRTWTLSPEGGVRIEIIHSLLHPDLAHVFDSFDFTVCQFATDGTTLYYTPQAMQDIETRTLNCPKNGGHESSESRIFKYFMKGFHPGNRRLERNLIDEFARNLFKQLPSYFLADMPKYYRQVLVELEHRSATAY